MTSRTRTLGSNLMALLTIVALATGFWALFNQPQQEPAWPERIQGFSYSPARAVDVDGRQPPTLQQIEADFALLAGKTHAIRTYSVAGNYAEIPRLARRHGLNTALGAWLDRDIAGNRQQTERLIEVSRRNWRNVVRVLVGNETLLRKDLSVKQISAYLDRVREALDTPVSTAEPWHVWVKHPELAAHVDYIAVHMLPYWEGIDVEQAVDYVIDRYDALRQLFPDKPIVISEVGWPSNGRSVKSAVASEANQAKFLRRFLARAESEGYTYYLMEAFDQPWKTAIEGRAGAHWGVYDTDRQAKFTFYEAIVQLPEWRQLALATSIFAVLALGLLLLDSHSLGNPGRGFLATVTSAATISAVWVIYDYSQQYLTTGDILVGILLVTGMFGVLLVLLTEAHEWAEALWTTRPRRPFRPLSAARHELPKVSIHVPAYNEPPEMMIETLDALAGLDYPDYEVVVVDNNTSDPAIWRPVQRHCARLGARFRFFHQNPLPGFKAGALNYALSKTAADAQVVAVIDSDYKVHRRWLIDLATQFRRPAVAIVQAPQDYSDNGVNAFKAMCYAEYRGFFHIGMVTRNERNAIIQHGTMTMVRRSVLEQVGGWAEWCITEDAELGLRIFEQGHEAVYVPSSYGKGVMPDTFLDFKKQRFRWAYGSIQILRAHAAQLLAGGGSRLSPGQRYHFIAGWLPWIADGSNLLFNLAALAWSLGMILAPAQVGTPMAVFAILPLALFVFKLGKLLYLYVRRVDASPAQTLVAALAGLSLSHTIAKAVLTGFVTRDKPFFRTPKLANSQLLLRALAAVREETLLLLALWLAAAAVLLSQDAQMLDTRLWSGMLLMQSLPYLAALLLALVSGLPRLPAGRLGEGWPATEVSEDSAQPGAARLADVVALPIAGRAQATAR